MILQHHHFRVGRSFIHNAEDGKLPLHSAAETSWW